MGKQVNGDLAKEDRRAFVALDRRHSTVSRRPKESMNRAGKLLGGALADRGCFP
jgi:hypothetical protein